MTTTTPADADRSGGLATAGLAALVALLVAVVGIWWFAIRDSGIDEGQIHGTWLWEEYGAYEQIAEDGTWGAWFDSGLSGDPFDWGTYTFDGETLTYYNADGSYCSGAVAVWTVEFSEDGQQLTRTFVEDSCTSPDLVRNQDAVVIRQTP